MTENLITPLPSGSKDNAEVLIENISQVTEFKKKSTERKFQNRWLCDYMRLQYHAVEKFMSSKLCIQKTECLY